MANDMMVKELEEPLGIFATFAWNQQDKASNSDILVTLQESDFFTLEE